MADERKSILLRLPQDLAEEINRWAADELRSVNAQIEYILREAVRKRGRSHADASPAPPPVTPEDQPSP